MRIVTGRTKLLMLRIIKLLLFIIFANNINAQLIVRDGSCYIYNNEKYCESEAIEHLFSYNLRTMPWHLKSISSKKKADFLGFSSVISLFVSYLLIRSGDKSMGLHSANITSGLGIGLLGCILGTIGISAKYDWANQSDKAVDIFNGASFGDTNKNRPFQISLGFTDNGLGLAFSF